MTSQLELPREAMGLGDVKFMAMIGAFLGWQAIFFSLMVSSVIGSIVGVALILTKKQAWSSRLPYGPYIALAAAFWVFGGKYLWERFWGMR
jgi:leader peptidase (prepilin peptidase)/N-methyltransferase